VYAFHTLNLRTRGMHQTLSRDKSLETAQGHGPSEGHLLLEAWKTQGIPHFLQLDNDAVFCGGYKAERVLGQFVRLCLFVGVELIFIPFKEPQHNYQVEQLNGLWGGHAFWRRHHFRYFGNVQHKWPFEGPWAPMFTDWYMHDYTPPELSGNTPAQQQRSEHRTHLTRPMQQLIPELLPITDGRIHKWPSEGPFIRRVQSESGPFRGHGTIRILNEVWSVNKQLTGRYVWATITTHSHRLDIWYRRDLRHSWRLVKHVHYDLNETVHHRIQPFRNLSTMS